MSHTYRVETFIEGDTEAYIHSHNVGLRDARAIATLKAKALAKRTEGQYLRQTLDTISVGHAIVRVVAN